MLLLLTTTTTMVIMTMATTIKMMITMVIPMTTTDGTYQHPHTQTHTTYPHVIRLVQDLCHLDEGPIWRHVHDPVVWLPITVGIKYDHTGHPCRNKVPINKWPINQVSSLPVVIFRDISAAMGLLPGKIGGCAFAWNAEEITDFKGNRELTTPAFITTHAWPLFEEAHILMLSGVGLLNLRSLISPLQKFAFF